MKIIISLLSCPLIFISRILVFCRFWGLKDDTELCLRVIDETNQYSIPIPFITILIVAEDRRNQFHQGIDPIAIIRACFVNASNRGFEGASTIEQQFVRVVSNRYQKNMMRKFREQILAISVTRNRTKKSIAKAYLSVAYYGYNFSGINGLKEKFNNDLSSADLSDIVSVISKLKYPKPIVACEQWKAKHEARVTYIMSLIKSPDSYR